jgi:phage shock protein PspC (stress-responsive transcriptional regulator)
MGVCGGLAAHFGVRAWIVRLLTVLSAVVTMGLAVIAYLILGAVIPEEDTTR